jgi:hypothetical protein
VKEEDDNADTAKEFIDDDGRDGDDDDDDDEVAVVDVEDDEGVGSGNKYEGPRSEKASVSRH